MAELPYMPFFVRDYRGDTAHLTDAEHGAYVRLLAEAWATPGCRLPNDDAWLARKLNRPIEIIQSLYRSIIAEFWQTDGNWIWQKRQKAEFDRSLKATQKKVDAAKARWKKRSKATTTDPATDSDNPLNRNGFVGHSAYARTSDAAYAANGDDSTIIHPPSKTVSDNPLNNNGSEGYNAYAITSTSTSTGTVRKEEETLKHTPETPTPRASAPPRKARLVCVNPEYPTEFMDLWAAYPVREQDTKKSCCKRWRTVVREHDPAALVAAANEWRAEQGCNPYRFGLLRWLRDECWQRKPPIYRPNGAAAGNGNKSYTQLVREYLTEGDEDGPIVEHEDVHGDSAPVTPMRKIGTNT